MGNGGPVIVITNPGGRLIVPVVVPRAVVLPTQADVVTDKGQTVIVIKTNDLPLLVPSVTKTAVDLVGSGIPIPGPPGHIGPIGPQGPVGPTSPGVTTAFLFSQASSLWLIAHNLNQFPTVTTVDSAGTEVDGAISYIDSDNIQVLFASAMTGTAYLN